MPRYRMPANVLSASVSAEEDVLLNTDTGRYYLLNSTARTVVEMLQAGDDLDAVTEAIMRDRDVPGDQVQDDLTEFINALVERGLVAVEHS